jgi:hypothetical protein
VLGMLKEPLKAPRGKLGNVEDFKAPDDRES